MKKLVEALKIVAMTRGVVVLDENLQNLEAYLKDKNVHVVVPPTGTSDEKIAKLYASHRIFVTNNSKDFIQLASEYSIGIIATEKLKVKDPEVLSKIVSSAITKLSLWSKRHGYIVQLKENNQHTFKPLVD